ncbi:S9 family peptidase [Dysgonomonas sp. 511]|uniref:S9 family peptidase n=1 Tax=Dysgonomonas sp. 511 TaxID=2302930 RepID=UPI0013D2B351|nr:S9 family peptidase [Dysgonomonas sp. 511]NDV78728.1 S9 family peptidase [Dysgonomonas sp. 511]
MKMRFIHFAIIVISIIFPMKSYSQDAPLTLEDLIPGGKYYYKYQPQMPYNMAWLGDTPMYVKGAGRDKMMAAPMNGEQKEKLFLEIKDFLANLPLEEDEKPGNFRSVIFSEQGKDEALVIGRSKLYLYNFTTKEITASYSDSYFNMANLELNSATRQIAYTRENNLYIQDGNGAETAVTAETDKGIVSGQSVHRNEFGINKGIFWSPQGNLLAFYRMDETMVTDYPLVDVSARVAKLKDIKYPMAGMKSHHVTVGVFDPATGETIFLKTGTPKEKYLTNIAWSPDEKTVYIAELNRGQDTCILKSYNAATGKLQATLFTETHPKYVQPENPVLFLKNDPSKFLWQSRRDGYNHLYMYDTTGKLLKQVTSGKWEVLSVVGFDEKGESLIYISAEHSPIEKHIYKVNLKSGERTRLSKEEGVHHAKLSASGKYIYDIYSSQYNPGKVAITNVKTNETHIFHSAKDPYKNVKLPEITTGKLKAWSSADSDLYYRLVKPAGFDLSKKYPVIVYVYGGPHSQLVDNSWMAQSRGWEIYMAQKGYLVFVMDNRGTSNRGFDFENVTHRNLGVVESMDQMEGIKYLKSLPYVDAGRIGVHGWSFGGFMTLNLMLRFPDTFKVGVAGGPVTDWKYYEVMYGERYMDSPQENPEGYKETNMVARAGDLKGRLLLIHGDEDPTVVMQHTLQFVNSAIEKGTHPDLFIYPGQEHNMRGRSRVHLYEHITRYFDDFLK